MPSPKKAKAKKSRKRTPLKEGWAYTVTVESIHTPSGVGDQIQFTTPRAMEIVHILTPLLVDQRKRLVKRIRKT